MAKQPSPILVRVKRRALLLALSLGLFGVPDKSDAITSDEFARREVSARSGETPAGVGREADTSDDHSAPTAPIGDPGPDLANFPNSSFTLPKGGVYVETSPLAYYGSSPDSPPQWNLSYLLRYGLFEDIEFRLFSNGLTFRSGDVGTSPLAIDTKAHLLNFEQGGLNASVGVEAYVQPSNWLATSDFRQPTQFAVTLLMDHRLPWDIAMGWNVGFTHTLGQERSFTRPTVQWAFQRNVTDHIAFFIQGFHNAATLPGVPISAEVLRNNRQIDVMGFGGQWTINERFAIFGNINWGLTSLSPKQIASLGFALAF